MNKHQPAISVTMSVYNSELFLREAVDSILNHIFTDFEFFIIDDCSKDSFLIILEEYSKKDNRIILLKNSVNLGIPKSVNKMINIAKGKYIIRMDSDDISLPERFERQYEFMERNPDIGVCGSNIRYFGNINQITSHPMEHNEIKVELLFKCVMMQPSLIIRKSVIDENNFRYNEDYKIGEDYELWTRMINYTKFANIKEVLVNYRFQSLNITNTTRDDYKNYMLKKLFSLQLNNLNIDYQKIESNLFEILILNKTLTEFENLISS